MVKGKLEALNPKQIRMKKIQNKEKKHEEFLDTDLHGIDTEFALSAKKKLAHKFKAIKFSRCKPFDIAQGRHLRNYSGLEHRLVNKP